MDGQAVSLAAFEAASLDGTVRYHDPDNAAATEELGLPVYA